MSTTGIGSTTSSSGGTGAVRGSNYNLKTEDFINMMVVQLQNQDPMEPAKNQELLAQMSQIGQLQSSNQLQDTLKNVMTQSQLSSAGSLIGKSISGTLADGKTAVSGVVNSVRVVDGNVSLELDSGYQLPLANVAGIESGKATTAIL
jgi:flagellar basal-body rod modification protein FlgD